MATPVTTAATMERTPASIHIPKAGPGDPSFPVGNWEPRSLYLATNRKAPAKAKRPAIKINNK